MSLPISPFAILVEGGVAAIIDTNKSWDEMATPLVFDL